MAYFFHASLQGTGCNDGAAKALEYLHHAGVRQGVIADGQCFSFVQLQRGLKRQDCTVAMDQLIERSLRTLSCDIGGRKPSERLFKHCLAYLSTQGITAEQVLHVGSSIERDLVPAKNSACTASFHRRQGIT